MVKIYNPEDAETMILILKKRGQLKGGDNSHLKAQSWNLVGLDGKPLASSVYDFEDLGKKVRDMGTTNVGDARGVMRAAVCIGEFYKNEQVVSNSKHIRPIIIGKDAKNQVDAMKKALGGDINSPFGGIWAYSKPVEYETAVFLNRLFIEGVIAPDYEAGAAELLADTDKLANPHNLKNHKNRFIWKTGQLTRSDVEVMSMQIMGADAITQDYDRPLVIKGNSFVAAGNNGNTNLESLDSKVVNAMQFGAVAATHLNSNLVFYATPDAIAGLGDGCGARFVAAMKGRLMLEMSVYNALKTGDEIDWKRALYGTPFTREEFEAVLDPNNPLIGFSDAFYPMMDGLIETLGIDRVHPEFKNGIYTHTGKLGTEEILLHKVNFRKNSNYQLVVDGVFQPGGSNPGDIYSTEIADRFNIPMVVAIKPEEAEKYFTALKTEKGFPKGHRFFTHQCS